MPLVVTSDEVSAVTELAGRLSRAGKIVAGLGSEVGRLLAATSWSGVGADAGREQARRLGVRLGAASSHLVSLSIKTHQTALDLMTDLARRRHLENLMLHELGRLAAVPGDLETRTRSALFHHVNVHLPAILRNVLP